MVRIAKNVAAFPILEMTRVAAIGSEHDETAQARIPAKETRMTTYFTIGDFILLIPMALAGALFLGAVPCATNFRHNLLRVLGAMLGVGVAVLLVEGLPALI